MTKKLTRSKRKELRARGELETRPQSTALKAAEKQAEERATSARVHEAREEIGREPRDRDSDASPAPAPVKKARDFTVLALMVGVIAVAGVLYYLTQRPPAPAAATPETRSSAAAPK